ncbi:MAG: hypothetical protein ABH858_01235, partial [Candidatus Omnitrophota bacterium]
YHLIRGEERMCSEKRQLNKEGAMKVKILIIAAVLGVLGFLVISAYANREGCIWGGYGEDVKTEVEKIDNGIQLTVTSGNKDIVKELHDNAEGLGESLFFGKHHGYGEYNKGYDHGCAR